MRLKIHKDTIWKAFNKKPGWACLWYDEIADFIEVEIPKEKTTVHSSPTIFTITDATRTTLLAS